MTLAIAGLIGLAVVLTAQFLFIALLLYERDQLRAQLKRFAWLDDADKKTGKDL
jgi:Flp pilus assembly protein protease CpaA